MPSFSYVIVNAFTRSPLGGNPAAIVLLPPGTLAPLLPNSAQTQIDVSTLGAISKSLAQPIVVFIAPPFANESNDAGDSFDIRYFVDDLYVPLCGHGTLATAKAISRGLLLQSPGSSPRVDGRAVSHKTWYFKTAEGLTVRACTASIQRPQCADPSNDSDPDGEFYEIELPANPVDPLLGIDRNRVRDAVVRALRKDPTAPGVPDTVRFVGRGSGPCGPFLMVALDTDEKLDGRNIDVDAFIGLEPFTVVSMSHLTPGKTHAFESRVFMPALGLPEDQVCGTAHTLMVPYYASLPESGVKPGQETYVRQVSTRGGELWVTFDEERKVVVLRGNAKLFAKGELMI